MKNLSHWDITVDFTGEQVAALIRGIDPTDPLHDRITARPVYERLERCYSSLQRWRQEQISPTHEYEVTYPSDGVASVQMRYLESQTDSNANRVFYDWLIDDSRSGFDIQRFSRCEISRWLIALDVKSAYVFGGPQALDPEGQDASWPWGNHHTELLGHLDAAARMFWVNYDPEKPKATAPKAKTIVNWLVNERGVSKTVATSMATMLRPSGLKTGPRK